LTNFIHSELKDRPDLIEKCVPTYPPYGKRILLDNNWFKTLTKPNVELVTDRIDHFAHDGIVASDGKLRPADIIVISTGFKVTEMAARLNITGAAARISRPHGPTTIQPPISVSPYRTFRTSS
jgi:4-hydroxyacetophenone monooxygenase